MNFIVTRQGLGQARPNKKHFGNADALQKWSPEWTEHFQELKICGHGTVLALYRCAQNAFSTNVSELLRRKKISRGCAAHVMGIAVCSERSSCPCLCSGVDGKSVSRPVGSWNFQGALPIKEKYRPRSAAMDFVGVNRRQNESGVLRGGWSFRDNPRWGSVQNEHDHILWMVLDQSTKSVGFVTENIMVRKARQDGFEKFIVVKRW